MVSQQTVCLRRLAGNRAREVQFGRWRAFHKVTPGALIKHACARTAEVAAGRHVLAIQDTTELNHQAHAGRVRDLGTVGNGSDVGMFLHSLQVRDAIAGTCLGLAHLHHWIRTSSTAPHYRQLPILEVRFGRTAIKCPAHREDKQAPKQIELHVIEVKELPDSVVGRKHQYTGDC